MSDMTVMSPHAEAAREASRTTNGTFGEQHHSAPELTLDDYAFPNLAGGLRPDQVGINLWISGRNADGTAQWQVGAFPWDEDIDGFPNADHDKPLFAAFDLPLSEAHAAELGTDDHWTTLSAAPTWLRDAITPALADDSQLHPGPAGQTASWRKQRHERLVADGAFATTYDNAWIIDFEDSFPCNTPADATDGLFDMAPLEDGEDETEKELAAAELTRRATAGVGGVLTDARSLVPGDQISLAWLADHFPRGDQYRAGLATVQTPDSSGAEGDVFIRLTNGELLCLPVGSRIPTAGIEYQGTEKTPSQMVQLLVRAGELPPTAKNLTPAEAIATYNAGRDEFDPDYIHSRVPSLTRAVI